MNKFYKKILKEATKKSNKHQEWIIKRDDYISKCSKYNIEWEKVKDAFILQDENMAEYLWKNHDNEFLKEIKYFIDQPSPSIVLSIYSNPVFALQKNPDTFSKARKRVWKYKKYKIFESYNNIKKEFEKKQKNIMLFSKYHNGKNIFEIQII